MKLLYDKIKHKQFSRYQLGVGISGLSVLFGIAREFIIVGMLGFSTHNDELQLYLSIFYTISLSIDAIRLSCLNLHDKISFKRLLTVTTLLSMIVTLFISAMMYYCASSIDLTLLGITIIGCCLNLMSTLLITYAQRIDLFLPAQVINVLPNFILIPGIILCYLYFRSELILAIISMTTLIPLIQCIMLLILIKDRPKIMTNQYTWTECVTTFLRHFTTMSGEQLFQTLIRSACYRYGEGFLTVFAMSMRIYAAVRFIVIDSFIGAKLASWRHTDSNSDQLIIRLTRSNTSLCLAIGFGSMIVMQPQSDLLNSSVLMACIMIIGFYLSTLVRIIYFKINHANQNINTVLKFSGYELLTVSIAYYFSIRYTQPILSMLWIGYIAKPVLQLVLLRKQYEGVV